MRLVPGVERLLRPARGAEQRLELRREDAADLRLAVVPRHRHAAGPVREVRQVEAELAVLADAERAGEACRRYDGSPYGASPITLNSSPYFGNPRNCVSARYRRPSECGKKTRFWMAMHGPRPTPVDVLTKSPNPSIAQTAASSNGTGEEAAREVRGVMLDVVHARRDVRLVEPHRRSAQARARCRTDITLAARSRMSDRLGRCRSANNPFRHRCALGSRDTANASMSRASAPAIAQARRGSHRAEIRRNA